MIFRVGGMPKSVSIHLLRLQRIPTIRFSLDSEPKSTLVPTVGGDAESEREGRVKVLVMSEREEV